MEPIGSCSNRNQISRCARHGLNRPLPARPAGEGDSVARQRLAGPPDPCHLVWQV